jgi:CBS domain-containing protein
VDTSAISYRVVDFLTRHLPFQAMDEGDLLDLAAVGRVRFHEANEYILWQGEPHKLHVFVIQQGTVSLWDEAGGTPVLLDVRGPGDMLGIERYSGAPHCMSSARSATDVVLYGFPAFEFENLLVRYPQARLFIDAYDTVVPDYAWAQGARDPQRHFVTALVDARGEPRLPAHATIRDAARLLADSGAEAIAAVDASGHVQGLLTTRAILSWVADGPGDPDRPVDLLLTSASPVVGSDATIAAAILAMADHDSVAAVVTADGSAHAPVQALLTSQHVSRFFGDQPIAILQDVARATTVEALATLNHRVRALALQHLTGATAVAWVARIVSLTDAAIVGRLIALLTDDVQGCWCVGGAAGRGESITRHAPLLTLILEHESDQAEADVDFARVSEALASCDYVSRTEVRHDAAFRVASVSVWQERYRRWLSDPLEAEMCHARPFFDLRPLHGAREPWHAVERTVSHEVNPDVLKLFAHDCLASLPPLALQQDAVVNEAGEEGTVFKLEHSALRPIVDIGRVFGLAAGAALGASTHERLASARALLPDHEVVFREAADTLDILLWQQGRIGIAKGTDGSELLPSALSSQDRHMLKGGFRSILRLRELMNDPAWIDRL